MRARNETSKQTKEEEREVKYNYTPRRARARKSM
jgi:hypothetical protein